MKMFDEATINQILDIAGGESLPAGLYRYCLSHYPTANLDLLEGFITLVGNLAGVYESTGNLPGVLDRARTLCTAWGTSRIIASLNDPKNMQGFTKNGLIFLIKFCFESEQSGGLYLLDNSSPEEKINILLYLVRYREEYADLVQAVGLFFDRKIPRTKLEAVYKDLNLT